MDDNALGQVCVQVFVGCDHGQCAKHSNLLPKAALIILAQLVNALGHPLAITT